MGAVLGRTSYVQLLVMGIVEIAVFSANSYLGSTVFKVLLKLTITSINYKFNYSLFFKSIIQVVDAGDSIFVHAFGAYFGLAVSYVLDKKKRGSEVDSTLEGSSYTSDLFAMIGK